MTAPLPWPVWLTSPTIFPLKDMTWAIISGEPGDSAAQALEAAEAVFERRYQADFLYHAQLEPLNAVANVTDDGQRLELWAGTQGPSQCIGTAAAVLGIPRENVTLHRSFLGGGFGRRAVRDHDWAMDAVRLSKLHGAPVKSIWSRESDVASGRFKTDIGTTDPGDRNRRRAHWRLPPANRFRRTVTLRGLGTLGIGASRTPDRRARIDVPPLRRDDRLQGRVRAGGIGCPGSRDAFGREPSHDVRHGNRSWTSSRARKASTRSSSEFGCPPALTKLFICLRKSPK